MDEKECMWQKHTFLSLMTHHHPFHKRMIKNRIEESRKMNNFYSMENGFPVDKAIFL